MSQSIADDVTNALSDASTSKAISILLGVELITAGRVRKGVNTLVPDYPVQIIAAGLKR